MVLRLWKSIAGNLVLQLSWKRKLTTVKSKKVDISSVNPSSERWRRANARNVSFFTLYDGQFTFSTQLLTLNCLLQVFLYYNKYSAFDLWSNCESNSSDDPKRAKMTDISTIWADIISSHLKEDLFAVEFFKVWSTTTDSLVFFQFY